MQNRDLTATAQKQTVLLVAQFCNMQNRDLTATETNSFAGGPVLQHAEPGSHRNRNKQFCWWPSFATCRTGISPQPKQTVLLVAQFCDMQNRDLTATSLKQT